jgi:hypothetical protein
LKYNPRNSQYFGGINKSKGIPKPLKSSADVIKPGVSLGRKAEFESKLQHAKSVKLIKTSGGLRYEADGYVGFEITLSHGVDFTIDVTSSGFIADYNTVGNTTKVVIINNETTELFSSTGDFEIVDVIAGTTGGVALKTEIVFIPTVFDLNDAYPNPFNPVTTLSFAIPIDSEVSLSIYNLQGREVVSLVNGNLDAGYLTVRIP